MKQLAKIAKLVRFWILTATTKAGSGHPTSALSAVELMVGLMFAGFFHFDIDKPEHPNNDRLIFSKGHAAPLFYALWAAANAIDAQELMSLRRFTSRLEGHPTPAFPYTEAATGSLGQGLSIGVGLALNAQYFNQLAYRTFVLLGDSEMSEGSNWEAIQIAAHYKLNSLTGIIDVNRLGQTGETMLGHRVKEYQKRITAFGWHTLVIDGHSLPAIVKAYEQALHLKTKPTMIIAKTIKGKGVSFLEDKENWHGQVLSQNQLQKALSQLGKIDKSVRGKISRPDEIKNAKLKIKNCNSKFKINQYEKGQLVATRQAYGNALVKILAQYPNIVVLDAEVSNSTYSSIFKKAYPNRFLQMFIAEQNMVSVALGLALGGKIPFVSTFAAFFTRAFDQIRMGQYSGLKANIKFVGSHAGVSIGQDGPSQMGLEDIAMFRTILNSVVLYPADALATEKLVKQAAEHQGIVYLRTTRMATAPIYRPNEQFIIGGSKTVKSSQKDVATVVAAGITLYEALNAYQELKRENILIRVIDLYSIKPIDQKTLQQAAVETKAIITVEDHFVAGGLGEAVKSALSHVATPIHSLAVNKMPPSGTPAQLLDYEQIDQNAIIKKVKNVSSH